MKLIYTLGFLLLTTLLSAQALNTNVLSVRLQDQLEKQENDLHHISILLTDRVDVQALDVSFYQRNVDRATRAYELITALQAKAQSTQGALLQFLENTPGVETASIRPYWITNMIFVKAKKEVIAQLSNRNDVEWMDINARLAQTEYEDVPGVAAASEDGIEPGLAAIDAPALWAMGYSGYGLTAFVNDTGVDPIHPAFNLKYRGFYAPAEEAWFQYDSENLQPFDCGDHGTHVLGTMIGLDRNANDTIGVAFNAHWIGAPILCGIGTEDNVAAFQWSLDPDEDPTTFADMPDVINNSWYDPSLQEEDCTSVYVDVLNALEASGIAVVFSAGNAGPEPGTITPPHNINTGLVNSFTVGALNANNPSWPIATFSSRGPSQCGGMGSILIKPEVSAPGEGVRSAVLNGEYGLKSGTSMASPHVCGAILLLREAFPELTGAELKMALYNSCTDLGNPGEDNTFGMGIINVLSAFNYLVDLGNEPVDPTVSRDLMLIDAQIPTYICDGTTPAEIKVENAGTETINSFLVEYGVAPGLEVFEWQGTLEPGGRVSLSLPTIDNLNPGDQIMSVRLMQPNNQVDERPLNNYFESSIVRITEPEFTASLEEVETDVACTGSSAVLRATYGGDGEFAWYSSENSMTPLAEGEVFLVDDLDETTTFYAGLKVKEQTGIVDPVTEELVYTPVNDGGILFDSYYPFFLKSVKVYVEQTGLIVVQLRRASGDGISSRVFFVNQTGEQRLDLELNVPQATDLELRINDGASLYHSPSGASYPYEITDLLTITGSSTGDNEAYYYFYDWELTYDRQCGRLPVTVEVDPDLQAPEAAFSASANEIDLAEGGEVMFSDNSVGATDWYWNFGDGMTSEEQNPTHNYIEAGTYLVTLTVLNADGCTDATVDTITASGMLVNVEDPILENNAVRVYPIPSSNQVTLDFDLSRATPLEISIIDLLGREIQYLPRAIYFRDKVQLNVENLSNGVYFVNLRSADSQIVKKIVKSE